MNKEEENTRKKLFDCVFRQDFYGVKAFIDRNIISIDLEDSDGNTILNVATQ